MTFSEAAEFLVVMGGTAVILMSPFLALGWFLTRETREWNRGCDRFYTHLERNKEMSRRQLDVSRVQKMTDEELKVLAVAVVNEVDKRDMELYKSM